MRDEFGCEQVEQFRMRRCIVRVLQVKRLDQASAHHHEPQTVDDVFREDVVLFCGQACGEFVQRAELRDAWLASFRVGSHCEFLALFKDGNLDLTAARDNGSGLEGDLLEDRFEFLFRLHHLFRDRRKLDVPPRLHIFEDHVQTLEILLVVMRDREVVVALSTLQIDARQQSPDVPRQSGHIHGRHRPFRDQPLRHEERRPAQLVVVGVRIQNRSGHHVPRFVLLKADAQKLQPLVVVTAPLHQHDMKQLLHSSRVIRTGEELFDEHTSLVFGFV